MTGIYAVVNVGLGIVALLALVLALTTASVSPIM